MPCDALFKLPLRRNRELTGNIHDRMGQIVQTTGILWRTEEGRHVKDKLCVRLWTGSVALFVIALLTIGFGAQL